MRPIPRALLEQAELSPVCLLGLPERAWASVHPDEAIAFLTEAVDKAAEIDSLALTGVTYGGIGERTGKAPTQAELGNVARVLETVAAHARTKNLALGIEPVNRYETHLLNTGWQAAAMVERVRAENLFIHLDTYHMNIEEKGVTNGILVDRILRFEPLEFCMMDQIITTFELLA